MRNKKTSRKMCKSNVKRGQANIEKKVYKERNFYINKKVTSEIQYSE